MESLNQFISLLKELGVFYVILATLLKALLVAFGALSVVFIFGRCLELVKKDRPKNILAVLTMLVTSPFVYMKFEVPNLLLIYAKYTLSNWIDFWFMSACVFLLSVILYVTLCWKFYDRVVALFDKFFPVRRKK